MTNEISHDLLARAREMKEAQRPYKVVFLATTANTTNPDIYFSNLRYSENTVSLYVVFRSPQYIKEVISAFSETVDFFMVDVENKCAYKTLYGDCLHQIDRNKMYPFQPNAITAFGFEGFLTALRGERLLDSELAICGLGDLASRIVRDLCLKSGTLHAISRSLEKAQAFTKGRPWISPYSYEGFAASVNEVNIMVSCVAGVSVLGEKHLRKIREGGTFVDVGGGGLTPEQIPFLRHRGVSAMSFSVGPILTHWLESFISYRKMTQGIPYGISGKGLPLVKFGYYGQEGEYIVDDVSSPQKVYGMSDGRSAIIRKTVDAKDL